MSPENGQMYVQKKPTMYPPWDSTFDAHINKGRVMQIIVKGKNVDLISETTVELCSLAERCRKNNGKTEIWVTIRAASSVREASTLTRPVPCSLKTSSNCPRHPKAVMREPRVNRPPSRSLTGDSIVTVIIRQGLQDKPTYSNRFDSSVR